jgi:amino acid transporter
MSRPELSSELTLFDVTNLVVGAIIGADIYVASSFGAGFLGPLSLVVWIAAGLISIVIALCFAQCASLLPEVGGPYAYAKEAWGQFAGFMVGWSLWLAEWIALAVFPMAFTRYLMFFLPDLGWSAQVVVKVLFVALLIVTNIIGVKAAGRTNDVLTLVKLAPLILFSVAGLGFIFYHPTIAASNYSPFSPFGFSNFGKALVLIFWAYAGFEISTIPADEIKNPGSTIPKAIVLGITIVIAFYLTTNIVLFGVRPWEMLANDVAPIASATTDMFAGNPLLVSVCGFVVGVGALISVAGSDESGMIGTSRLAYALAVDGLFPHFMAKVHQRFKTPYLAIIIQAVTALFASIIGNLEMLISTSVFFMAVAYLSTGASVFWLKKISPKPRFVIKGGSIIAVLGVIFSLYLISQCTFDQITVGLVMLAIGVPIYVKFSPKKELGDLKKELLSKSFVLERTYRQEQRFLAHALRHIKRTYRKITRKKQTWSQ